MTSVLRLLSVSVAGTLVLLVVGSLGTRLDAQAIAIKLVDGRTGRPMADSHVNVWVGHDRRGTMVIPTDKDGVASLRLADNDRETDTRETWEALSIRVVRNPLVRFDDLLRVNAPFVQCEPHGSSYSWLATRSYSSAQVIREGIVTPNTCGKVTASPKPGELTILVRPLHWWEALKE